MAHTPQRRIFRVCLFSIISQNYPSSLGYHRVWNEDQTRSIINSKNSAWVATLTSIYTCLVFELSETEFPEQSHLLRETQDFPRQHVSPRHFILVRSDLNHRGPGRGPLLVQAGHLFWLIPLSPPPKHALSEVLPKTPKAWKDKFLKRQWI